MMRIRCKINEVEIQSAADATSLGVLTIFLILCIQSPVLHACLAIHSSMHTLARHSVDEMAQ